LVLPLWSQFALFKRSIYVVFGFIALGQGQQRRQPYDNHHRYKHRITGIYNGKPPE
tara:strand:- start:854 stop:1021 length:168 start_codon:yes stop_codon:yes gene_type:complete